MSASLLLKNVREFVPPKGQAVCSSKRSLKKVNNSSNNKVLHFLSSKHKLTFRICWKDTWFWVNMSYTSSSSADNNMSFFITWQNQYRGHVPWEMYCFYFPLSFSDHNGASIFNTACTDVHVHLHRQYIWKCCNLIEITTGHFSITLKNQCIVTI